MCSSWCKPFCNPPRIQLLTQPIKTPPRKAIWNNTVIAESDCVCAAPSGQATRHIVNVQVLDALGPQGFLVNIGRGSVVDTEALAAALREGRIAAPAWTSTKAKRLGPARSARRAGQPDSHASFGGLVVRSDSSVL